MTKALLMIVLATFSTSVAAEWAVVKVNEAIGAALYMDTSQVAREGDTIKAWTLVDYLKQPWMGQYRSVKTLDEFQCKGQLTRTLEWLTFSGAMGSGERLGGPLKDPEWKNVEPGTLQGEKWKILCGK